MRRLPISLLIALILALTSSGAYSQDQWPYYGGTQWGERHVKFSQIGRHNVAHLVPRRVLQLGEIAYSMTSSPLVIDGVLYVTGAGVNAPPIAYELDGEEYIAVAAGGTTLWASPHGDTVFVFGLPKKWEPTAHK
jgi:glucose dehydrogenase